MQKSEKFTTDMTIEEAEVTYDEALGALLQDKGSLDSAAELGAVAMTLQNAKLKESDNE